MDESGKTPTVDWVKILGWLDVNKKRVATWAVGTVVVVVVIIAIFYHESQKEVRASRALSDVVLPLSPSKPPPPGTVEALLKIEKDYPGTKAAARAMLEAAGVLFAEGQYDESQRLFVRFEKQYPESVWLPQALLGYAATLTAQNKNTEALAEYEKLRKRYPTDAIADEVKLGLARLYEKQNKPEEALALYQDILRANPANYTSIGAEAGMWQEDLLQRYPNLMKTSAPPVSLAATNLAARKGTNRTQTISLTNLVKRTNAPTTSVQLTNRPGTNIPLLIKPPVSTSAPPVAPK